MGNGGFVKKVAADFYAILFVYPRPERYTERQLLR